MANGLDLLNQRLGYRGGNAEARFINDKLNSLKKALLYSYQSETIELEDGRQFRALLNPDKLKNEYDNKTLSIPFKDICLNKDKQGKTQQGIEETALKPGDVFRWVDTDTYWIIYLQYLEENAYFRADVRKCNGEVTIGDNTYHIYIRGPIETTINWNLKSDINWNDLNYSQVIYITKNEETLDFFHRFKTVEINNKPWEVRTINSIDADGIIEVVLKETYQNTIEKEFSKKEEEIEVDKTQIYIEGKSIVKPYDILKFSIENLEEPSGRWYVDNKRAVIREQDSTSALVEVISGKKGSFNLVYTQDGLEDVVLPIKIISL
jgi:hypothetical protein